MRYHTVGAGMPMRTAEGGTKPGAMLTRREYLCDASFLIALQGEPALIAELEAAIKAPKWILYLGRKSCPPSRPLLEHADTAISPISHRSIPFPGVRGSRETSRPQVVTACSTGSPTE